METTAFFLIGLIAGLAIGVVFSVWRVRSTQKMAQNFMSETLQQKENETERLINQMKESFGALSLEALSKNTEDFLKIANENLSKQTDTNSKEMSGKKDLIDQTLKSMKGELDKVSGLVTNLEKDRKAKFDVLSESINKTAAETKHLRETTHSLQSALTNSRVRGQWGERMAEDVLRLAGFVEGINYRKQETMTEEGSRPDYTFYLPQERIVNMDVKFPLENYLMFTNAETEAEKEKFKNQFLKDAKNRIHEVTKRHYVDTVHDTLDYVLVFIPNEQVYSFINEHDQSLVDDALSQKIILCSPTTLYAVLAVIRQAVDNFHLERTASQILGLLGDFNKQWGKFVEAMDKVGKRINDSQVEFEKLTGTRRNMLERPLRKIEELRSNEKLIETDNGTTLKVIETVEPAQKVEN